MKKLFPLLLAVCLTLSLTAPCAEAAAASLTTAQETVSALGIMVGDENGNMNLSANVTRAQLAKMMIAASTYKDTVSATSASSPFKDVSYKYWGASYIQAAVTAGWLTGYSDGSYRPDRSVTLEEAATAVLKMLGYETSDFSGAFPDAQLVKYTALGLNTGISKVKGQYLTRQDAMYLFYNLMSAKTTDGKFYAATLGYTVNDSGEIDYASLVKANMKGPFIVKDSTWTSSLPFSTTSATVYKNGSAASLSAVTTYDVYYYNASMRTVWVYRNQVTGTYTAASPSTSSPSSVTVAGNSYTLSGADAAYALSDLGQFHIGDTVTLLLGMNGEVVGAVAPDVSSQTKYGFVTASGTSSYTDNYGNTISSTSLTVLCTDGNSYQVESSSSLSDGTLVRLSLSGGKYTIQSLSSASVSGTVNASGSSVASYSFASDIRILDSTPNGSYLRVYPSRLAGMYLSSSNVRYYALDSSGEITDLILNDATGDAYKYGILTSAKGNSNSMNVNSSYKYLLAGVSGSYSSNSTNFGVSSGPALFEFSGNELVKLQNLTRCTLSAVDSTTYATASDGTDYKLSDSVSVYIYNLGTYTLSSIQAVSSGSYTLSGYYDKAENCGGRIRIIIAS